MRILVDKWRRIGARLYLALGFAVLLTLVSSAVGVYYFERSGDLNYQVESESVPALEASWTAAREAERLRALGLGLLVEPDSGFENLQTDSVVRSEQCGGPRTLPRLDGFGPPKSSGAGSSEASLWRPWRRGMRAGVVRKHATPGVRAPRADPRRRWSVWTMRVITR